MYWSIASGKKPTCQCRKHKRVQSLIWEDPRKSAWQPTKYSCLENPLDRVTWQATVHWVAESQTRLTRLRQMQAQQINNVVMVSSGHPRDSVLYIHESILPQTLPIPAATKHWAEFPVLYSRTVLVIHFKYIRVYMSIPNSLTIPSWLLYLLVTMRSFSKSVSFL